MSQAMIRTHTIKINIRNDSSDLRFAIPSKFLLIPLSPNIQLVIDSRFWANCKKSIYNANVPIVK